MGVRGVGLLLVEAQLGRAELIPQLVQQVFRIRSNKDGHSLDLLGSSAHLPGHRGERGEAELLGELAMLPPVTEALWRRKELLQTLVNMFTRAHPISPIPQVHPNKRSRGEVFLQPGARSARPLLLPDHKLLQWEVLLLNWECSWCSREGNHWIPETGKL